MATRIKIDSLLKKKKLTGEEVGKIVIYNTTNSYEQVLKNGSSENIISDDKLRQLVSNLPDKIEWDRFKLYDNINEWVVHNFSIASAYEQQAQLNLEKLINSLNMVGVCESVRDFYYTLPEILTEKSYTGILEEKKKELLNDESTINMIDILEEAITGSITEYNNNKRKKSIGKSIYNITSKEKPTERIIKRYEGFFERGEKIDKITKWDILGSDLFEYYKCFDYLEEGVKPTEWHLKDFQEFINDYSEVFKMLVDEIKEYFPEVENLPLKDWFIEKYQYKQLYELNFFDILTHTLNNQYFLFNGNYRALFNGVSILKHTDKEYKGVKPLEDLLNTFCFISLEQLARGGEEAYGEIEKYRELWAVLYRSLYFLQGYDKTLDIIIEYYGIKNIEIFKSRFWWFRNRTEALNQLIDLRLSIIESNVHEDLKQKEEKIKIYHEIFEKIDLDNLKTPEENIKEATQMIAEGLINRSTPKLINLMADYDLIKEA